MTLYEILDTTANLMLAAAATAAVVVPLISNYIAYRDTAEYLRESSTEDRDRRIDRARERPWVEASLLDEILYGLTISIGDEVAIRTTNPT